MADRASRRPRSLVVGVGNELRRDDGVGAKVARAVGERAVGERAVGERAVGERLPRVDVRVVHQVLPELAETMAGYDVVVLVDAAAASPVASPDVATRPLVPAGRASGTRRAAGTGHHGDPEIVLGLVETLGAAVPQAWLVTVPAADLGLGSGLSPAAAALVPKAVAAVEAAVEAAVAAARGRPGGASTR